MLPSQGHILSLLAVNGMLFSGSNDSCIHVWKYDAATGIFNPAVRRTVFTSQSWAASALPFMPGWTGTREHVDQHRLVLGIYQYQCARSTLIRPSQSKSVHKCSAASSVLQTGMRVDTDRASCCTLLQIALTSASGGHAKPVQSMVVVNQFMFSADWGGSIKV